MADRQLYLEIEVDERGAIKKLTAVDKGLRGINDAGKQAEKGLSIAESAMLKATAAGTFLGNALYDIAARAVGTVVQEFGKAIKLSSEMTSAMMGLGSVAAHAGVDITAAKAAAKSLAADGLMKVSESALGLKNLLASGFNLPQSIRLMEAFKDAAAFGRQASLDFGYAVASATEGVKNGMSAVVDNAGVTKNLGRILEEAGFKAQDLGKVATDTKVRLALFNGIIKETAAQTGDAAKLTQTYTGQVTKMKTQYEMALQTLGAAVTENKTVAKVLEFVSGKLELLNDYLTDNGKAFDLVSDAVINSVKALQLFLTAMDYAQTTVIGFFATVAEVGQKITSMLATLTGTARDIYIQIASTPGLRNLFPNLARDMAIAIIATDKLEKASKTLGTTAGEAWDRIGKNGVVIEEWQKELGGLITELEKTRGQTVAFGDAQGGLKKTTDEATKSAEEQAKALAKTRQEMVALAQASFEANHMMDKSNEAMLERLDALNVRKALRMGQDAMFRKASGSFGKLSQIVPGGELPEWMQRENMGIFDNKPGRGGFLGGITGGFKDLWGGLTGGKNSISGLLGGIGGGMVEGFGQILSGGLSSLISTGLGFATKGLGKLFGGLFGGGEGKKTNDTRDSWVKQITGLDDLPKAQDALRKLAAEAGVGDATMRKLFDSKKVKDFESAQREVIKALEDQQSLTDAQKQRQELLNEAMGRYKFSIEELGPAMQKQQLAEQAERILTDYELLTAAGVDHTAVIREMSDSINEFVKQALKTGTEVPEAMRPLLQAMVQQGKLTDANGEKITDLELSGIKFGETLTEMFKGVLKKLDELILKLTEASKDRSGTITIHENHIVTRSDGSGGSSPDNTNGGSSGEGGGSGAPPIIDERMHWGGFLARRAHTGLAIDEVPIIAQSGEGILSRRAMRMIGGRAGLNSLNNGGVAGGGDSELRRIRESNEDLAAEMKALRRELRTSQTRMPYVLRRAMQAS